MRAGDLNKDVALHLAGLRNVFQVKSSLGQEYSVDDYNRILNELRLFILVLAEELDKAIERENN